METVTVVVTLAASFGVAAGIQKRLLEALFRVMQSGRRSVPPGA